MAPSVTAETAGAAADVGAAYRAWIECVNGRRWSDALSYLDATLEHNGVQLTPAAYVSQLRRQGMVAGYEDGGLDADANADADADDDADDDDDQSTAVSMRVDQLVVDQEAPVVACRLRVVAWIRRRPTSLAGTGPSAGSTRGRMTFSEQQFVWFSDGRQSKILSVRAGDEGQSNAAMSQSDQTGAETNLPGRPGSLQAPVAGLPAARMEELYRAYIACINARRMESDLALFCSPAGVTHNGRTLAVPAYGAMIQESIAALPDLHFGIHTLLADEPTQRLAVRLEFRGTPARRIAGLAPSGRAVRFAEHVSYQLVEGRIARVWSIVDWAAARAEQARQAAQAARTEDDEDEDEDEDEAAREGDDGGGGSGSGHSDGGLIS